MENQTELIKSIYALLDPRTSKVMYVGSTRKPMPGFWKTRRIEKLQAWLKELEEQKLEPIFTILEESSSWIDAERKNIELLLPPLNTMMMPTIGPVHSVEHRAKLAVGVAKSWEKRKRSWSWTPEQRAAFSGQMKKTWKSREATGEKDKIVTKWQQTRGIL